MCRKKLAREAGVGLIAAVFVIVILALLGTALIRLLTAEQASTNREFASTQAFFAAETAVQWGLYQRIAKTISSTGQVFDKDESLPAGLANCEETRGLIGFQPMGTAPTFSADQELYRFEVEGVCYEDRAEEASRRLEVRFWDWAK